MIEHSQGYDFLDTSTSHSRFNSNQDTNRNKSAVQDSEATFSKLARTWRGANPEGSKSTNQASGSGSKTLRCYNCEGEGHRAPDCKRRRKLEAGASAHAIGGVVEEFDAEGELEEGEIGVDSLLSLHDNEDF